MSDYAAVVADAHEFRGVPFMPYRTAALGNSIAFATFKGNMPII